MGARNRVRSIAGDRLPAKELVRFATCSPKGLTRSISKRRRLPQSSFPHAVGKKRYAAVRISARTVSVSHAARRAIASAR